MKVYQQALLFIAGPTILNKDDSPLGTTVFDIRHHLSPQFISSL